jgi:hypothetical protein
MKIKVGHRRDFTAYLHWSRTHLSIRVPTPRIERGEASALVAFVTYESTGRLLPTRQPRLLAAVLRGKADLNRQIKDWAGGYADCGGWLYLRWVRRFDLRCVPAWAFDAARRQHYAR